MLRKIIPLSLLAISCSSAVRAKPADTTPFIKYPDRLHSWEERAPYDAVWSADPEHIAVKSNSIKKIYVAPINTEYLNKKRDDSGRWVSDNNLSDSDIHEYTTYLRNSFINAIKNNPSTNLALVETPDGETITLAISLVELVPTKIGVNVAVDAAGVAIPGSKILLEAGAAGAQVAGGAVAGGTVAFEMMLLDNNSGAVLFEAKDRETDPTSVVPNYRDFEEYGWSRETADEWSEEFAKMFETSAKQSVDSKSQFSFVPW